VPEKLVLASLYKAYCRSGFFQPENLIPYMDKNLVSESMGHRLFKTLSIFMFVREMKTDVKMSRDARKRFKEDASKILFHPFHSEAYLSDVQFFDLYAFRMKETPNGPKIKKPLIMYVNFPKQ
jgi:hypothetical protein